MALGNSAGPEDTMTLRAPHGHRMHSRSLALAWPLMVSEATDINTDPGCNKTTDHIWSLAATLVWMIPLPQLIALATQISVALAAALPSKTNMVTDSSLDPGFPCDLRCHHGSGSLTQTLTVIGPWAQVCPWHQPEPGCHHGPRWQCRTPRLAWLSQQQHIRQTQTWPQLGARTTGFRMTLSDKKSQKYQHRPLLLLL